jgi:hypothetical protein
MGGINSSDLILYTFLDERQTVHCWKKVAFNIIARMVLNNYILSIIESLGEKWLVLRGSSEGDDPQGP